ncbi:DUF2316 family protein [Paenibacillus albus]|uniref:DUF2316 family protein n=1 Tax=Paenibacillus albus TaxID=2495582 RepID=UPI00223D1F24|nr:DUF2316 family protein [Paenibacillus albus]
MSKQQVIDSSKELKANYLISGLTSSDIKTALGLNPEELEETLSIGPSSHPEMVWRLRDYMEDSIKASGKEPHPYSVLITNIWYKYK